MTRLRTATTVVLVATLLTGACGGTAVPDPTDPTEAGQSPTPAAATTVADTSTSTSVVAAAAPDPLDVELTPEPGSAVSATVDREGGSVEAVSAEGARYTLTIPRGALTGEAEVVVTPLASVSGGGLDGVSAGVNLEPEGLVFLEPVTLTIAGGGLTDGAVGFSTDTAGHDFHLTPAIVGEDSVSITTGHFSAYGYLGWGNVLHLAERYTPRGAEATALQALTLLDMQQMPPQQAYAAESLVFGAWAPVVLNDLHSAQDDASLDHATLEMLSFILRLELRLDTRQSQGIDVAQSPLLGTAQAMIDAWFQMAQAAVDRYVDQCESGDPAGTFGILRWLSIGTSLQIKFTLDRPVLDSWTSEMEKCFQFRVEWETTVGFTTADGPATTKTLASAEINAGEDLIDQLLFDPDAPAPPHPQGSLEVTGFELPTVHGSTCTPVVTEGKWDVDWDIKVHHLDLSDIRPSGIKHFIVSLNIVEPPAIGCEEFEALAPELRPALVDAFWRSPVETANKPRRNDLDRVSFELDIREERELYAVRTVTDEVKTTNPANGTSGTAQVTQIIRVIYH